MLEVPGPETSSIEISACDVDPPMYEAFFSFAGLRYTQLTHPYDLPYADSAFDVVMGSDVLEHVPHDSASLQELYRIIRVNGHVFIVGKKVAVVP
jgi:SAM-dependent methyltransferase